MADPKPINLVFPARGMNRAASLRNQPQLTSSEMNNMRPFDPVTGRLIGSRRSGLGRWDQGTAMGSGGVVNMLDVVEFQESTARRYVEDFPDSYGLDGILISDTGGISNPKIDENSRLYYNRATTWAAETEYVFEQLVEPTVPNGFYYENTSGVGTSGATEPTAPSPWPTTIGDTVTDGDITWTCRSKKAGGFINTTTDTTQNTVLNLFAVPYNSDWECTYRIYLLCNATPDPDVAGVTVAFAMSGSGNINLTVTKRNASATTGSWTNLVSLGFVDAVDLFVVWTPSTTTLEVRANGTSLLSQNIGAAPAGGGDVVGWSMEPDSVGFRALAERFTYIYHQTTTASYQAYKTIAAAGGKVYRETGGWGMTEIDATKSVNSSVPIQTAQLRNKLYIADYGPLVVEKGNDSKLNLFHENVGAYGMAANEVGLAYLISTGPNVWFNWVSGGVDAVNHIVEIVGPGTAVANSLPLGTYKIDRIISYDTGTNNLMVLKRKDPTTAIVETNGMWAKVWRAVKVYDPSNETLVTLNTPDSVALSDQTYGTAPANCNLISTTGGRLVLCDGSNYYESRIGDPTDWNYSVNLDLSDAGRAVSDNLGAFQSLGQTIKAMWPLGKDHLLFGTEGGFVRQVGNLADGGYLESVNADFGVSSPGAACALKDGSIVFMTHSGIMRMAPVSNAVPEALSESLPGEFQGLDPQYIRFSLVYDLVRDGILIMASYEDAVRRRYQYWFDMKTKGFYRDNLPDTYEPICAKLVPGYFRRRFAIVLGGRDGHLYYLDRLYQTDSGTSYQGWATFGPYLPNYSDRFGSTLLNEIMLDMGNRSQSPSLGIFVGDRPEEQYFAAPVAGLRYSRTLSAGINRGMYPKLRGRSFVIKLSGTLPWQMESGKMFVEGAGWL